MDSYEATRVVFSRIQNLDPENASKIMGLILIQDHGEKEMIRLAFGPESVVHSVIYKAKKDLGLSSNSSTTNSTIPTPPLSFGSSSIPFSRHNSSSSSTRLSNGVIVNLPSPLNIPNPSPLSCSWATSSNLSEFNHTPDDLISPNPLNSAAPPFYGKGELETDLIDEFQLQDQLSFLNVVPKLPEFYGNSGGWDGAVNGTHHRWSCSVSDICYNSDDPNGGFEWKPCLYFARGYCKNGSSCRFLHGGISDSDGAGVMNGSPSKVEMMEQCHELMRSKSVQQQRLAAASELMGASTFSYSPSKSMNFLFQQQNDSPRAAAALMMGDEMNKFDRSLQLERNEFSLLNTGSRQIYLTFPAESTFREEDVSNYFSIFGPVQDVRIPYQQKRMFGFATFLYADTVKLILAKGNPHFICGARVLVKPYKEKGKVPDKFRKQQMERGEFPACGSPTGLDSRDPFDIQLGARMLYNTEDILRRRKLEEQAYLRQAIELQNRRLMGLQLLDVKSSNHHHALSTGAAISSPTHLPCFFHRSVFHSTSERSSPEFPEENGLLSAWATKPVAINQRIANGNEKERDSSTLIDQNSNGRASPQHNNEETDLLKSLEHNLPDNLFALPKSADAEKNGSIVVSVSSSANNNLMASTLDMASLTSCYFQAPRFASTHGAIGM